MEVEPLLRRVGDARIVMLGEASHGTHEFYRVREEITRRLISELGFSFVAVEGDWPDCDRVNDAVMTGGSPRRALERFQRWPTWMWANSEVETFCDWLREHNSGRPRGQRVGFHGLDVYSLWESLDMIADFARRHAPGELDAVWRAYECFEPYGRDPQEYATATRFVSAGCEPEVVKLLAQARQRQAGQGDGFSVRQNAEVVEGAERYYRAMVRGGPDSWNIRDVHMAETLDRLLEHYGPQAKAVVWAHNTHIGDARATDMAANGMVNIGQLARERHGDGNVVLVGFGSNRGEVIAADQWDGARRVMKVPPARRGSLEDLLHNEIGPEELLVFPEAPAFLFGDAIDHRAIGVVYHPEVERWGNYVPTRLGERYDAFAWIDRTGPLHPLHTAPSRGELETYPSGV